MMIDLENDTNLKKWFYLENQGQPSRLRDQNIFFEIPDFENIRIDTKIESIASIPPKISKVIWRMCMTLSFKVKR